MKTNDTTDQKEKGQDNKSHPGAFLVLSGVLFATVCAVSAFLFFENMSLSGSIEANKAETLKYTSSIEKIKSDKKNIAAELVANNKSEIISTIKKNEAQKYVKEVLDTAKKYKLMFSGFAYENGKVSTAAVSVPETVLAGDDGVKKISAFIKDYRTATIGSGSIFNLSPILSISGHEQKRTFSIEFNVKDIK